jgi:hypothetical protein
MSFMIIVKAVVDKYQNLWLYSSRLDVASHENPDEVMYDKKRLGISTVSLVKNTF